MRQKTFGSATHASPLTSRKSQSTGYDDAHPAPIASVGTHPLCGPSTDSHAACCSDAVGKQGGAPVLELAVAELAVIIALDVVVLPLVVVALAVVDTVTGTLSPVDDEACVELPAPPEPVDGVEHPRRRAAGNARVKFTRRSYANRTFP